MNILQKFWDWLSGLVGNNPKLRPLIFLFVLMLLLAIIFARSAKADEIHLQTGVSVIHGTGPFLAIFYRFAPPHAPSGIDFRAGLQIWGQTSVRGTQVGNNWSQFAAMDAHVGPLAVGLGFVRLQRIDRLDGTHVNLLLGLTYAPSYAKSVSLSITHISNAGTSENNVGRNAVAVDWRLR